MMRKLEWIIGSIISIVFLSLIGFIVFQTSRYSELSLKYHTAVSNNKAYEAQNDSLKNKSKEFQLTIDQLNYSTDSLVSRLNELRKQLKIKDADLKNLQYIASQEKKVDTLFLKDTIFRYDVKVDTVIKDEWSKFRLQLEYPNKIVADYSFKNSTIVAASSKRETINPPKKFFLCRWFQKKHEVINIDIIQENPYCETKEEKFIKIIK